MTGGNTYAKTNRQSEKWKMNRGDPDPAYRTGMQAPPLHVDVMGDDHEAY